MPGPTGAEPWELWFISPTGTAECVQTCANPIENRLRKNSTLALPVAQVFCQSLWLNETDSKQFAGMISLQLEMRGLQPRGNGGVVFDWSVVAQEGTRTLVVAGVLPTSLAAEVQAEAYDAFDLSARYLPFPGDTLTLWLEQDRLAVALTRGQNLVYYQALAEGRLTPRVIQDLICIRATLTMHGIVVSLTQVMLWAEASPAEVAALQAALQLPVKQTEHPSPRTPPTPWKLVPASVSEVQKGREARRWRNRAALMGLIGYLLFVAWMVSSFFITSRKADDLRRWQTEHAADVALVRETRATWRELHPVVDESSYPLEVLLHIKESIPTDELHLTMFQADDRHLLLKGEAKNVAAAYQFLDNLKKNSHFAGYTWNMAQPTLAANDLAKLQIDGTIPTTN